MFLKRALLPCFLAVALAATPVVADLASDRTAVFQQLLARPNDRSLMMQYARLSVEARDYEAAVSTLERVLDTDPASVEARYELAQAYFALGSNEIAEYHLNILQKSGALTPAEAAEAQDYQAAITRRTAAQGFYGFVELGAARLTDGSESGPVASMGLTHILDLGDANQTLWITELNLDLIDFGSATSSGQSAGSLTTGPAFRLTGDSFGPILRPYLTARVNDDDEITNDRTLLGVGATFEVPLSAQWSVFAGLEGGRAKYDTGNADGDYVETRLGAAWRPTRTTQVRASLLGREIDVGVNALDNDFRAVRLDYQQRFRPSFARHDWVLTAYAQTDTEDYKSRRDDDTDHVGAALRTFLTDDVYLEHEVRYYDRTSTVRRFNTDETMISIRLGWEF